MYIECPKFQYSSETSNTKDQQDNDVGHLHEFVTDREFITIGFRKVSGTVF